MSNKNGKDADFEEFNERFESVEQALKYVADSQAKSEWIRKKSEQESRARFVEIEKHLAHITKILRLNIEDHEFSDNKIEEAGKTLSRKRKR